MIDPIADAMTGDEVYRTLVDSGAILSGHFVLTSGRHSDTYVQCARILEDPALTMRLARAAVARIGERQVDMVASPAVGALVFGFAVAQALEVRFIFTERKDDAMTFRRGFEVPRGANVLIAEDVVTTGGSVGEVERLVEAAGGRAIGVVSIIDRGGPKSFKAEPIPLLTLEVESWEPGECAPCASGIVPESPGSRRLSP